MGTTIRPELSQKNKYWIERHRYYELKHFCMQYSNWRKIYYSLDGWNGRRDLIDVKKTVNINDQTAKIAQKRAYYAERMDMIERVARKTDEGLSRYILIGVTQGISYDILKVKFNIPCGKDTYYDLYRRFFWLLDKERQ